MFCKYTLAKTFTNAKLVSTLLIFMLIISNNKIVAHEDKYLSEVTPGLMRLGSEYGGWVIPKNFLKDDSVCYCFGAGEDISFDLTLIKYLGVSVYSFDPTPHSIEHINYVRDAIGKGNPSFCNNSPDAYSVNQEILDKLLFFPVGIWKENESLKFYIPKNPKHVSHPIFNIQNTKNYFEAPCKKLSTIMNELGHVKIDFLKLDIEGAEYPVLLNMLEEKIYPKILCVEFHDVKGYNQQELLRGLMDAGYKKLFSQKRNYTFVFDETRLSQHFCDPMIKKRACHHFDSSKMKIHEYCIDLFNKEMLPTEYSAYCLLKQNPIDAPVNYLAIPWSVLINGNQLQKVPKIKLNGGFTICQHIQFEKIIPLLKAMGINTLFTPHIVKGKRYVRINVLPFPHLAINAPEPALKKDIWYSFIGFNTHWTRSAIFKMPQVENIVIKQRKGWHFWGSQTQRKQEAEEYENILSRSRFSLCPSGRGPSTPRFWESLRAGAIPVLIADDMMLPEVFDWDSCIIRIAEKDIYRLNEILSAITVEQETVMRENCLICYEQFSGDNFVSVIHDYYNKVFCK